jgi:hypothetical protein
MTMTNMKSEIFSSENLYVKHFHIADTNYNLFLEEKMKKLTKKDLLEKKKKMKGKMQIAQKKNVLRTSFGLKEFRKDKIEYHEK